ncbi:MAG TPA: hypothetical protein VK324_00675 [Tepidisphaeraceae bacterium]|nr:hypothetical protein [Tepidisphaeraceae bacterium]
MTKIDNKTFAIGMLGLSALVMTVAHLVISQQPAIAAEAVQNRDYQVVTAGIQAGGEALYVSDNRTGQVAVLVYDPGTRSVVVKKVRSLADAFGNAR